MAIIGTLRAEEAKVFDSFAGYHSFHSELRDLNPDEPGTGSFLIEWYDAGGHCYESCGECEQDDSPAGWYWIAQFPGCLPDGDSLNGPFSYSRDALADADEWNPEFDE